MSGEIYMAAAAALAYEKRLEVMANNLANVNTAGFKRDDVSFQAYLTSEAGQAQAVQPPYATPQAGSSFLDCLPEPDRLHAGAAQADRQCLRPGLERQGPLQRRIAARNGLHAPRQLHP